MSKLVEYTLEIYKADRRVKGGYRFIEKKDFAPSTKDYIDTVAEKILSDGFIVKVFETYVTKIVFGLFALLVLFGAAVSESVTTLG